MIKPKVLLIDDDQSLLDMYSLKFRIDGTCDLVTAANPQQGIRFAMKEHPDLILLDLVLPKIEESLGTLNQEVGFQLLERLKNDIGTKSIPVVIFTNLDEKTKNNVERALLLGAHDYWVKAHWLPADIVRKVKDLVKSFADLNRN